MEPKKVLDRRKVKLEDVLKPDFIPFLGGRPVRTTVITMDDIANLFIALNTAVSLDDFLTLV